MNFKDYSDIDRRLHSAKEDVLKQVNRALEAAGLRDFHIESIRLQLKHPPLQCPDGMEPVWEPETLADGTVVYRWVCKVRK